MDVKPLAMRALESAHNIYEKDLEAIPAEAYAQHFGGKARTVADITHEVLLVNQDILNNMRGQACMDWPEGWVTAPENCRTKEEVLAAYRKLKDEVISYANGLSEEEFMGKVVTEHGETNRFERCRFMAMHMMYHSGQLNFIQTLLGDDGWNW